MKTILTLAAALLTAVPSLAATPEELDQLLQGIKSDIAAKRLSSPESNNALDKITEFRAEAPFDYRVVPLAYEWGEAYVALSQQARAKGDFGKAQGYLDNVWRVAALTPGLEEEQRALDESLAQQGKQAVAVKDTGPDEAELERQRTLAEAAEKEKLRLQQEAEKQRRIAQQQAAEKAKREAAEKARREQQERERRAALAAAAAAPAPAAPAVASPIDLDDIALDEPVKPVARKVAKPAPVRAATPKPVMNTPTAKSTRLWAEAREDSEALAEYPVPADLLASKNRKIAEQMGDICQAMIDKDASVVIHMESKSDYRWLAVRLTLCARRIDRSYRLRHSFEPLNGGEPKVSLHPPRSSSLIEQVN